MDSSNPADTNHYIKYIDQPYIQSDLQFIQDVLKHTDPPAPPEDWNTDIFSPVQGAKLASAAFGKMLIQNKTLEFLKKNTPKPGVPKKKNEKAGSSTKLRAKKSQIPSSMASSPVVTSAIDNTPIISSAALSPIQLNNQNFVSSPTSSSKAMNSIPTVPSMSTNQSYQQRLPVTPDYTIQNENNNCIKNMDNTESFKSHQQFIDMDTNDSDSLNYIVDLIMI